MARVDIGSAGSGFLLGAAGALIFPMSLLLAIGALIAAEGVPLSQVWAS